MACKYIFYISIFGSVVRAMDFYPGRPGSNPIVSAIFFQLCFTPLLRLSCSKMGARPESDLTSPKMFYPDKPDSNPTTGRSLV